MSIYFIREANDAVRTSVRACACAIVTAVAVLSVVAPCAAQDPSGPDSVVVMGEVVIADSMRMFGSGAVRIRRFRTTPVDVDRGASVAELLADRSLVDIRREGPTGTATASVRGAGATGTPVIMDGFRLADPQTGTIDLSMIPLAQVETVELVHGPSRHTGALGGSVVLRSRHPADVEDGFSAAVGAFGHRTLSLSSGGGVGGFEASLAAVTNRVDGDFPYRNTAAFPARNEIRHGAGRQSASVSLAGRKQTRDGSIRLLTWYSDATRGVPGPANAAGSGAVLGDRLIRAQLGMSGRPGRVRWEAGIATTSSHRTWQHPDDGERTFDGLITTVRAGASRIARGAWLVESAVRMSRESARVAGSARRDMFDVSTQIEWFSDGLMIEGGLDFSGERTDVAVLPSAAARVDIADGAAMRVSAARSIRRPTLNELYWTPGGNPDLNSERGWMVEAGLAAERTLLGVDWAADAGVYSGRVDDRITWQPALAGPSVRVWRPINVGLVELRGFETGLEGRLAAAGGTWTLSAHGSRSSARDLSNPRARSWGRQLRYVPGASAVCSLAWMRGAWSAQAGFRWTGRRFTSSDESLHLEPYRVTTIRALRRLETNTVAIRLGLTIENLENADYELMHLYPMPPRRATFTLSITTHPSDS